jgi:uncharacterized protein
MQFEWDDAKDRANEAKHGIGFLEVVRVFAGRCLTVADNRKSYGEPRFVSVGKLGDAVIVVVVHTPRNGRIRLISARLASARERRRYDAYCQENP